MKKDKSSLPDHSELRSRAEEQLKKSRQAHDSSPSSEELPRLLHELSVHQIELEMQKEELQLSRDELQLALTQYTDLYDFAPLGYLTLACDSTIRKANLTAEKLLGKNRSLLLGDRFIHFIVHNDRSRFNKLMERVFSQKQHGSADLSFYQDDYRDTPAPSLPHRIMLLDAIVDDNGQECRLTLSDITDRKQAEDALKRSEERFRNLFESHAAAKMVIDPVTGSIIDANQAAAEFYGWKVEELQQMKIDQIIILSPEEIKQTIENSISGEQQRVSFRHRMANGFIRDVEVYSNKIETKGQPLIYSIIVDVTERKRLEALADGMITTDLQGIVTSTSSMALHLFGATDQTELVAKPFATLVHTRDLPKWYHILQQGPAEMSIQKQVMLCKKGNDATFLAEISVLKIHDYTGATQLYQLIIRDITQQKLIESQQLHTRSLIGLGEMAAGIAHEISQPINTISLIADKMLDEVNSDSPDLKSALTKQAKKIMKNIARMQIIVDNIRSFASKDQKSTATVFDCQEPIQSALSVASWQCAEKSIELEFKPLHEKQPIKGNYYKVEQVILNLIRNSIDALEEKRQQNSHGNMTMRLHLQVRREKESVIISVTDNGIGISQENIDYILQPFFSTKQSGKGSGLGLSICYRIIKEMHGMLSIASTPMQGTTVQLTLPLEKKNLGDLTRRNRLH